MSQTQLFFTGIALSLALGIAVPIYLRRPLHRLLIEICGTQERAAFWTQLTTLSYLLMAAATGLSYRPENFLPDYYYLSGHLGRTLVGLLVTTAFVSLTLSGFIRRQERLSLQAARGQ